MTLKSSLVVFIAKVKGVVFKNFTLLSASRECPQSFIEALPPINQLRLCVEVFHTAQFYDF